jgi:hypothetical protein
MKKGVHFLAKGVVKMYGCKAAEKEKFMSEIDGVLYE